MIDYYSDSSGRQGYRPSGRSTPPRKKQVQMHNDRLLLWELRLTRWQIKWQIYPHPHYPENGNLRFILIDSYSDSSCRLAVRSSGRSTPPRKKQVQIHNDRLLLWQLRQTSWQIKWQIYLPPENGSLRFILIDSYSDSSGRLGGRSAGRSTPQEMTIWD